MIAHAHYGPTFGEIYAHCEVRAEGSGNCLDIERRDELIL